MLQKLKRLIYRDLSNLTKADLTPSLTLNQKLLFVRHYILTMQLLKPIFLGLPFRPRFALSVARLHTLPKLVPKITKRSTKNIKDYITDINRLTTKNWSPTNQNKHDNKTLNSKGADNGMRTTLSDLT